MGTYRPYESGLRPEEEGKAMAGKEMAAERATGQVVEHRHAD